MKLNEIMQEIESVQFEIRFSVLSGFNSVISAMEYDETVAEFVNVIDNKVEQQRSVLVRIQHLIPQYNDGYLHPHDIAVTAYLFALNKVNSYGTLGAIVDTIAEIPEFWWARKLARNIQQTLSKTLEVNQLQDFSLTTFPFYTIDTSTETDNKIPA